LCFWRFKPLERKGSFPKTQFGAKWSGAWKELKLLLCFWIGCLKWVLPVRLAFCFIYVFLLAGCGLLKKRETPGQYDLKQVAEQPLSPDDTKELLDEVGENWLYGQGMGGTALTVGTVFVFPPYALWLAGNSVLSLSGYEPVRLSDALPEQQRVGWNKIYGGAASMPGRTAAAMAGEEYRSEEIIKERYHNLMKSRKLKSNG